MGQVLHKCAKTTHVTRAEIQQSQESISKLAKRYGVNPKTIVKWKKRSTVCDSKMGKKVICSTVLSAREEEMIVRVRVLSKLPLDDLLCVLKDEIPHLTRSSLHRCLKRHGVSILEKEEQKKIRQEFKTYQIGYFHMDTAELRTEEGRCYLFVAIDRTSKFCLAQLYGDKSQESALHFLKHVIEKCPYSIHTILTDNGTEYTDSPQQRGKASGCHAFDRVCQKHFIEHKLTKVKHPWTNGQVERMNRTIKDHTVYKYFYKTFQELANHLNDFMMAYNCAKKLRALNHQTPLEFLTKSFIKKPVLFKYNPYHYYPGPYS